MNARKQIKKKQHKINKILQEMNKNIANDNLWRGRFVVHQVDRFTGVWEDNSGTWIDVVVIFIDKKTGLVVQAYLDYHNDRFFASDVWWRMNQFITEDVKVWDEGRKAVYEDTFDWNKVVITDFNKYYEKRI
jgi:hypothetical protein